MSSVPGPAAARQAAPADLDAITSAFTTAFFNDPVWAPVFPDETRLVLLRAARRLGFALLWALGVRA